jgi:hypothetical protein
MFAVGTAARYGLHCPVGARFSAPVPDRPWGPPIPLYNGYWVSFPGAKRPRRGVNHPPTSSAEVKERVELHFFSPSRPSWPVLGQTLAFFTFYKSYIRSCFNMLLITTAQGKYEGENSTHSLTHKHTLTPWSRVLPEKLKRPQLLKKSPTF